MDEQFIYPVDNYVQTGTFDDSHKGIDLAVPEGSPVVASKSGKAKVVGWDNTGYGCKIILEHEDGEATLYGHLQLYSTVRKNAYVRQGEQIALSGNTGNSTGPHLHFEIWKNRVKVDPDLYLKPKDPVVTPSGLPGPEGLKPGKAVVIAEDGLKMRSRPEISPDFLGLKPYGEEVIVDHVEGDWAVIIEKVYMWAGYLRNK